MPRNSEQWDRIAKLLDVVLDQRGARERELLAKLERLRARTSAPRGGSTSSSASGTAPPLPRRNLAR
jgi:hypothetical protein